MSSHAALLPRYQQLRQAAFHLNNQLVARLPRDVIAEGERKLGVVEQNLILLGQALEMTVLMDYCLHDVRRQGINAFEGFLAVSQPPSGSDERILLEAAVQARYALVGVESLEPGVGVYVRDLFRDEALFLFDVSFSRSAVPGLLLATRIMGPDGSFQTTGAALPMAVCSPTRQAEIVQAVERECHGSRFRDLDQQRASDMTARIIRTCLAGGATEHIVYSNEPRGASSSAPTVGRYDPCPCGSGKKFKFCCERSRRS